MARGTVLLIFALGVWFAEGIRIDLPEAQAPNLEYSHPGKKDERCLRNGVFPIKDNCKYYLACRNGEGQVRKCPEGLQYDSIKRCTKDKADCGRTNLKSGPNEICARATYGMFPDPEDCHKYIICVEGETFVRTCPENQAYNQFIGCIEGQCSAVNSEPSSVLSDSICDLPPDGGMCRGSFEMYYYDRKTRSCKTFIYGGCQGNANRFEDEDTCQRSCLFSENSSEDKVCTHGDKLEDQYDCSVYYECRHGVKSIRRCRFGRNFDYKTKSCQRREDAHCIFNCVKPEGRYPIPNVRTKYIECKHGKPRVKTCPSGEVFNPTEAHCEKEDTKNNDVLNILDSHQNEEA